MWELENKKCWAPRTDAYELWYWRRLSRVPWTARRSNQSILKEINPEYSLEWLMQKLQCFGHLMQRADSLEKTLMLGKIEGRRREWSRGWQRFRWLDGMNLSNGHEFKQTLGDDEGQGSLVWCHPWGYKEPDMTKQLNKNKKILIKRGKFEQDRDTLWCAMRQERQRLEWCMYRPWYKDGWEKTSEDERAFRQHSTADILIGFLQHSEMRHNIILLS